MENKRVYIKFTIKNNDIFFKIQNLLKKDLSKYELTILKRKDLHLTLFHYGKPKDLFEEMYKYNQELSYTDFLLYFNQMIENSKQIISLSNKKVSTNILGISKIKPVSRMLDLFGSEDSQVIVLRLSKPREIFKIQRLLIEELKIFLVKCGIKHTTKFMSCSENLKWQVKYNPHISIAAIKRSSVKLPEYDFSGLQVLLSKIVLID